MYFKWDVLCDFSYYRMVLCLPLVLVSMDNLGTTPLTMRCDLDLSQNYGEQRSPGLPVDGTVVYNSISSYTSSVMQFKVKGLPLKCLFFPTGITH